MAAVRRRTSDLVRSFHSPLTDTKEEARLLRDGYRYAPRKDVFVLSTATSRIVLPRAKKSRPTSAPCLDSRSLLSVPEELRAGSASRTGGRRGCCGKATATPPGRTSSC